MDSERVIRLQAVALRWFGVVNLTVVTMAIASHLRFARRLDFACFWGAGALANRGEALTIWSRTPPAAAQLPDPMLAGLLPIPYPPPFVLLVQPFALLPFGAATLAWVGVTLGLFILVARGLPGCRGWGPLAFAPMTVNGIIGQTGFLTGALFLGGSRLLATRPFLAGWVFGCLIVKPQFGLVLPIAFIAGREWRAFAGAAVGVVTIMGVAMLAYGVGAYVEWLDILSVPAGLLFSGSAGWEKMASVFAVMRMLGAPQPVALTVHGLVAATAITAVVLTWARNRDPMTRCAILIAATALTSPYFYVYDMTMLLLPMAWVHARLRRPLLTTVLGAMLVAAALLNWLPTAFPNPAPLFSIVLLALVLRESERDVRKGQSPLKRYAALGAA